MQFRFCVVQQTNEVALLFQQYKNEMVFYLFIWGQILHSFSLLTLCLVWVTFIVWLIRISILPDLSFRRSGEIFFPSKNVSDWEISCRWQIYSASALLCKPCEIFPRQMIIHTIGIFSASSRWQLIERLSLFICPVFFNRVSVRNKTGYMLNKIFA